MTIILLLNAIVVRFISKQNGFTKVLEPLASFTLVRHPITSVEDVASR